MKLIKDLISLNEATADDKKLSYEKLDEAKLLKLIKQHCSKTIWMFKTAVQITRYDRNLDNNSKYLKTSTVGSKRKRKSQNTTNYYTEIFDNLPSRVDFPKRSSSIIAIASLEKRRWIIIPYDNAKVGIVGKLDMWLTNFNLFDRFFKLKHANDFS